MTSYSAPLRDMRFVMEDMLGLGDLLQRPSFQHLDIDLAGAILDQAASFGAEVVAPLNQPGDRQGATWSDHSVTTPDGYAEAYRGFVEAGWQSLTVAQDRGGQEAPKLLGAAVQEIWKGSSHAWSICQALTQGAIEALIRNGSEDQIERWLPRLIDGSWTGTMNLTEPQAGSDLSRVRTRAVRQEDGSYLITGQKVFISFGEHDMSDNIVHFVLARTAEASTGTAGISLFIVPKYLMNADGTRGARNDVQCVGIENKLGLHGSPTCAMVYGAEGGAIGELIGPENQGLRCMFTMMNSGRISAGLEGIGVAERALQQAASYARGRIQGRDASGQDAAIVHHGDVRRMLMLMRARVEAGRALSYWAAAAQDLAVHHPDAAERARQSRFVDLITPVAKAWCTELGHDVAQLGVQVHGGMGYIEDTGAAQHVRDLRISTIYEGTTGIQAQDLIDRKIARDGGETARALVAEMRATLARLGDAAAAAGEAADDARVIHAALQEGIVEFEQAIDRIVDAGRRNDPRAAAVGNVSILHLVGTVCGCWMAAEAAIAAVRRLQAGDGDAFYGNKLVTMRFYAEQILPQAAMYSRIAFGNGDTALRIADGDI